MVCDYVHLNPVRAKLLTLEQRVRNFAWSSWPEYLKPTEQRPHWLRVDRLLGELHIPKDSVAGREELENYLEVRRAQEVGGELKNIRRGWYLGGKSFRQELLEQARAFAGESRVSKLKLEPRNKMNLSIECNQD